jgi:hypothetical protein
MLLLALPPPPSLGAASAISNLRAVRGASVQATSRGAPGSSRARKLYVGSSLYAGMGLGLACVQGGCRSDDAGGRTASGGGQKRVCHTDARSLWCPNPTDDWQAWVGGGCMSRLAAHQHRSWSAPRQIIQCQPSVPLADNWRGSQLTIRGHCAHYQSGVECPESTVPAQRAACTRARRLSLVYGTTCDCVKGSRESQDVQCSSPKPPIR